MMTASIRSLIVALTGFAAVHCVVAVTFEPTVAPTTTKLNINPSIQNDDFCYRASWDRQSGTWAQSSLLKPVFQFPHGHSLTDQSSSVCEVYAVGSAIPDQVKWSETGNKSDCQTVAGSEAWYAYNYPNKLSSNVGFE